MPDIIILVKLVSAVCSNWPLVVILFLSLILSLWRLDELITIGGDQGYDSLKIKGILDGDFTLLGSPISRFGDTILYLGPLYYYLQAPFLALAKLDPVGLSTVMILGKFLTVFFVYKISMKLFNLQTAICAAVLSALSGYFLTSLGLPSQPYLIPFVTAAVTFLLLQKKNNILIVMLAAGFLSGLTANLHYLGLSIFFALCLYQLYAVKSDRLKSTLALFTGLILAISPQILFELRNNFFLTKQIVSQMTSGIIAGDQTFINQLTLAINLISEGTWGANLSIMTFTGFFFLAVILALKGNNIHKPQILFLLSVIIINFVFASLYGAKVQSHYLAAAYVPMFIFAGLLISTSSKINKFLPLILLAVLSTTLIAKNDILRSSGHTMPEDLSLRQIRQISKIIADDVGGEVFNITSTLDGDSRALPYRYLVDVYGKKPLDVQTYDKGDSLYVITRDPASSVRTNSLFEIASFQPSSVINTWNIKGDIKLFKLSKKQEGQKSVEKFVTIINPVRSRDLWQDKSIDNLTVQLDSIKNRQLASTWLLQYDTLDDLEVLDTFKKSNNGLEVGALLEVSEKWATDSRVSYKIGEGDYYRPDKIFLSGYDPKDREKLIKTYIKKFQQVFGQKPQVTGAWYVDARSQALLAAEGVRAQLVVADQYDTDALASWGKYWSMPFYPSKYNSLEPASSQSQKIPIVNIQWAQRHPTFGYGREISDSRHSFQANDYINNGFDGKYFDNLLEIYLKQEKNDFMQITLGLETGQEAITFLAEFESQLDRIGELRDDNTIKVLTASSFADWYIKTYPGISPSHFIEHEDNFWYMSPKFRAYIAKVDGEFTIKDLRYYKGQPLKDYVYADQSIFLDRKVLPTVEGLENDSLKFGPLPNLEVIENFDRLTLKSDNIECQINTRGISKNGQIILEVENGKFDEGSVEFKYIMAVEDLKNLAKSIFSPIKFSIINGQVTLGIATDETLVGFQGARPAIYKFGRQTLLRFKTPASLFDKYQPWLN